MALIRCPECKEKLALIAQHAQNVAQILKRHRIGNQILQNLLHLYLGALFFFV